MARVRTENGTVAVDLDRDDLRHLPGAGSVASFRATFDGRTGRPTRLVCDGRACDLPNAVTAALMLAAYRRAFASSPPRGFAALGSTRCPPEGMRVVYRPNPASHALYMRPPRIGERGSVTSIPLGARRATCLPGPGGGLVYVDWDEAGPRGIAPGDIEREGKGKAMARRFAGLDGTAAQHGREAKGALRDAIGSVRHAHRVLRGGDCLAGYGHLQQAMAELAVAQQERGWLRRSKTEAAALGDKILRVRRVAQRLDLAFREKCVRR